MTHRSSSPHTPSFFGPALAGACLGVILSIPIAAYTAAWFGDTYDKRVLIYGLILLWCVCGAVAVYLRTYRTETQRLTFPRILLWCLSLWLWPLLILPILKRKFKK